MFFKDALRDDLKEFHNQLENNHFEISDLWKANNESDEIAFFFIDNKLYFESRIYVDRDGTVEIGVMDEYRDDSRDEAELERMIDYFATLKLVIKLIKNNFDDYYKIADK